MSKFEKRLEHLNKSAGSDTLPDRRLARDAAIYVNDTLEVAYAIAADVLISPTTDAVLAVYDRINAEKIRREQLEASADSSAD